ncbi:MAG: hypothetical protein DRP64_19740 [Verrucomicrobia bacterium]|nr:MAG: hypothetical protein DRP64_19740 [Verrucomicrobiota bacterium]
MKIRRSEESQSGVINISSLLDVMFILIIFFLATTTFKDEERDIKVSLPENAKGESLSSAPKVIVINVRQDGSYIMANGAVIPEKMQKIVLQAVESDPEQKVLIRGDQNALHGHVAAAVAMCRHAGIHEVNIGYQLPQ